MKKSKGTKNFMVLAILAVFVFSTQIFTHTRVCKFQNVKLPFDLKIKNSILKNGTYHFEFLRHSQGIYYLRILKRGRTMGLVQGDQMLYGNIGTSQRLDPNIPKNPRLKFTRDPLKEKVYIVFESGKNARVYPFIKVKFKLSGGK